MARVVEAVFTPAVLAEFDEIGRAPHRAHNPLN